MCLLSNAPELSCSAIFFNAFIYDISSRVLSSKSSNMSGLPTNEFLFSITTYNSQCNIFDTDIFVNFLTSFSLSSFSRVYLSNAIYLFSIFSLAISFYLFSNVAYSCVFLILYRKSMSSLLLTLMA